MFATYASITCQNSFTFVRGCWRWQEVVPTLTMHLYWGIICTEYTGDFFLLGKKMPYLNTRSPFVRMHTKRVFKKSHHNDRKLDIAHLGGACNPSKRRETHNPHRTHTQICTGCTSKGLENTWKGDKHTHVCSLETYHGSSSFDSAQRTSPSKTVLC